MGQRELVVLLVAPLHVQGQEQRLTTWAQGRKDGERVRKMDMNMISKDPLGEEIRAHVYTAAIVHEPCRIVGIELHHDSKDIALLLTADEAGELGDALLKGAKELRV
jgi:hypothetical protein